MKKTLISIMAVVFCICATFGFSGCTQVEEKVMQIKDTINQVTQTIGMLEEVSGEVTKALEDAEEKANELQSALDEAEAKLDEFDAALDAVKNENAQLRKEINCLKGIHFAKNATYEWVGISCTATGVCEICGSPVTETVTAVEVDGVLTATFSLASGFVTQIYTPAE